MEILSYSEFLVKYGWRDTRDNWILWKMVEHRMTEREAIKAADDPEWGWTPLDGNTTLKTYLVEFAGFVEVVAENEEEAENKAREIATMNDIEAFKAREI